MSTEANVAPEVLEAIRDVRNDATSTDWYDAHYTGPEQVLAIANRGRTAIDAALACWAHRMLARHLNNEPQEIELAGSGSGGVNELIANLDDSTVMYGLCTFTQAGAAAPVAGL